VVVFITNHAHDDTGDLYASRNFCAPVEQVSSIATLLSFHLKLALSQFMNALLPSTHRGFLQESEVTLWMMSCGGLFRQPQSFQQLASAMRR
jgi:hypothetical protein